MRNQRIGALVTAFALSCAIAATPILVTAQQTATLAGTAKDEAKKPFTDFTVQAREIANGTIVATTPLNLDGNFSIPDLSSVKYMLELVNKNGKIVCTEGPYDLAQQMLKNDVVIDCNRVPAAWWILGAAAAAGITAGVVTGNASPAQ